MVSRVQLKLDVINGRDQQRLTLPMLGKAEVDQYLQHMGMQDADLRQRVFEVTHGLALCVSIIGDFWQQREAQKEPLTIADFPELKLQEFSEIALMQFTNERILKQLKSPFKELTRYGVLLRSFDLPLLRNVFIELLLESEALDRFNQLIRYPYIESRGNYRYAFHELLREVLAEETQKEEPEEWKIYHKRAMDYLSQVSPHSPDWYYHLLAYDEKQGLVEWQQAIQEARERGKREFIGALLQAALDEALHLSPTTKAEVSFEQGRFNYYGVQWEEALKSYNAALAVFQQVEDYAGQAKVLQAIGDVQRTLGKQDDALASYEQALALFRRLGDQLGEARSCQAMGDVQRLRNDLDTALHCYEQCLDLFQQLKDRSEEAKVLEAMGDVQRLRNQPDMALQSYEQALTLYQEEKDRLKRAKVLKAIGDVQRQRRERNAALESYGQALALYGELKEPAEEANVRRAVEEMEQPQSKQGMLLESVEYVDQADRSSAVSEMSQPVQQRPANESLMMDRRAGQRFGNYRLIRLLGQGGFAEVYLGEHVFLGTQAAIKVLLVRLADEEMEGFLKQARTIAGLTHPNILRVLEFGVEENVPFLVMDYAPNGTLRKRHPRGTILPLTVVVPYVSQIASALQYIHTRKLIHRDIKPENLLLGTNYEVLLGDFGTAMVLQALHDQGTLEMAGTVSYMAPEQIRGKPRPASDQYGLGVVVYEWLCGARPFQGTFTEMYSQHILAPPPSLRARNPMISPEVEQVVLTALSKEPEQRFASVSAFANALEQASKPDQRDYSSGSSVVSQPSSRSSHMGSSEEEGLPTLNASVSEFMSRPASTTPHYATQEHTAIPGTVPVAPQPVITPEPVLPQPKDEPSRSISRRSVVVGLLGLGCVAVAGGAAWLVVSKQNPFVFGSNLTPTVLPSPIVLATTPLLLDFGKVTVGQKATLPFTVANHGQRLLHWSVDTPGTTWLKLQPKSGTIPPGGQEQVISVTADASNLTVGFYSATIHVTSNAGNGAVPVHLEVIAPSALSPELIISPSTLDFGMVNVGQVITRIIIVGNSGSGTLNWEANTGGITWVTLDPTSGSVLHGSQQAIAVSVNTTSLSLGDYAATINITSNGGRVQMPLTLRVI